MPADGQQMRYALALHVLGAVVWVGGMFFAYLILRPSVGPLAPAVRLALWRGVLGRFFGWVWVCLAVMLGTGFAMLFIVFGSTTRAPTYARLMMTLGIVMAVIFVYVYFAPWSDFRRAIANGDATRAARGLREIRILVAVNLVLGLTTVVVGAGGPYF
jgi:uncharacterized membrane protein